MVYTEINTIKQLADFLKCKSEFIESIINNGYSIFELGINDVSEIEKNVQKGIVVLEKFKIQKKNKSLGYRVIHKPLTHNLSNTLKILNNCLSSIYSPIENVHGFVKGKNIKTNATMHLAKKHIYSFDIKDFFDSISVQMIEKSLIEIGFQENAAHLISLIVTVNGFLVQGFNTSPTIANIVAKDLDNRFKERCGDLIVYSRYADDIYFSSNDSLPETDFFNEIVESFGFVLNKTKTQYMKRGQKQYVTGLTVFDSNYPRITKKIKRNLRLEIFYIKKYGYEEHVMKRLGYKRYQMKDPIIMSKVYHEKELTKLRLWGWIHFVQSIEPQLGDKYEKIMK